MAEYIEREALLEDIQAAVENGGMGGMVAGALKRYVTRVPAADVAPVQKWISVKDRLPRDGEYVIVVASGKCENITLVDAIEFAEFDMSEGWILEMWPEWENPKITYWMPSPEPPKAEKGG